MFIKGGRFYPFRDLGDDLADIGYCPSAGFEVDNILAYPVSVLNNKGYRTLQCCEGHPLNNVYYEMADEYSLKDTSDNERVFEIRKNTDGVNYVCFKGDPDIGAFVIFEKGIDLPSIPDGWEHKEDNSIRWDCKDFINPTDYYKRLIFAVESLTLWAEGIDKLENDLYD